MPNTGDILAGRAAVEVYAETSGVSRGMRAARDQFLASGRDIRGIVGDLGFKGAARDVSELVQGMVSFSGPAVLMTSAFAVASMAIKSWTQSVKDAADMADRFINANKAMAEATNAGKEGTAKQNRALTNKGAIDGANDRLAAAQAKLKAIGAEIDANEKEREDGGWQVGLDKFRIEEKNRLLAERNQKLQKEYGKTSMEVLNATKNQRAAQFNVDAEELNSKDAKNIVEAAKTKNAFLEKYLGTELEGNAKQVSGSYMNRQRDSLAVKNWMEQSKAAEEASAEQEKIAKSIEEANKQAAAKALADKHETESLERQLKIAQATTKEEKERLEIADKVAQAQADMDEGKIDQKQADLKKQIAEASKTLTSPMGGTTRSISSAFAIQSLQSPTLMQMVKYEERIAKATESLQKMAEKNNGWELK